MHNKTLLITVGLPYSGKSTWAMAQEKPVVSPDAIRLSLHGERYSDVAEQMVWTIAHYMVQALFTAGHKQIIVDGCHITQKRRDFWRPSVSGGYTRKWNCHFHVFETPDSVCRRRAIMENDVRILPIIERMSDEWETDDWEEPGQHEEYIHHRYDANLEVSKKRSGEGGQAPGPIERTPEETPR